MLIRPISHQDIPAVAALLHTLATDFIVHDIARPAAATFLRENSAEGLQCFIDAGIVYHVAEINAAICGFVAVREHKHLFHLFVERAFHGRGIARQLWQVARQAAIDAGNEGIFTVNASNYAMPVYEKFGFVRTAPTQEAKGLRYNPMQLGGSIVGPTPGPPSRTLIET